MLRRRTGFRGGEGAAVYPMAIAEAAIELSGRNPGQVGGGDNVTIRWSDFIEDGCASLVEHRPAGIGHATVVFGANATNEPSQL